MRRAVIVLNWAPAGRVPVIVSIRPERSRGKQRYPESTGGIPAVRNNLPRVREGGSRGQVVSRTRLSIVTTAGIAVVVLRVPVAVTLVAPRRVVTVDAV